jgi:hypothetical protein
MRFLQHEQIGEQSIIRQNASVDGATVIGNNVKIENTTPVCPGAVMDEDLSFGPSCVITSVKNPAERPSFYEPSRRMQGAQPSDPLVWGQSHRQLKEETDHECSTA